MTRGTRAGLGNVLPDLGRASVNGSKLTDDWWPSRDRVSTAALLSRGFYPRWPNPSRARRRLHRGVIAPQHWCSSAAAKACRGQRGSRTGNSCSRSHSVSSSVSHHVICSRGPASFADGSQVSTQAPHRAWSYGAASPPFKKMGSLLEVRRLCHRQCRRRRHLFPAVHTSSICARCAARSRHDSSTPQLQLLLRLSTPLLSTPPLSTRVLAAPRGLATPPSCHGHQPRPAWPPTAPRRAQRRPRPPPSTAAALMHARNPSRRNPSCRHPLRQLWPRQPSPPFGQP